MSKFSFVKIIVTAGVIITSYATVYADDDSILSPRIGRPYQGGIVACLNGPLNDFVVTSTDVTRRSPWGKYNVLTDASSI